MCCVAVSTCATQAEAAKAGSRLRCQQRALRQRVVRLAEEPGKARRNSGVVLGGVNGRFCRGQNAEEVVGARGNAVAQQKPCRLKALDCGDGLQQTIVGLPFQRELALDKRVRPERRAQDIEALLVTGRQQVPRLLRSKYASWHGLAARASAAYSSLTRSGDATM